MSSSRETIAIIGAGVVGSALGKLLSKRGYSVVAIASRSSNSARRASRFIGGNIPVFMDPVAAARLAKIVLITTPDRAIREVCDRIAAGKGFQKGGLVLHVSGFHSSRILNSARRAGAYVGSLHPLQSFASPETACRLIPDSVFGWEATQGAQGRVLRIIRALGGVPMEISPSSKAFYHAAAVMVSNYAATIFQSGTELLDRARSDDKKHGPSSSAALMPLLLGTASNLYQIGLPKALTGPIARGELGVVKGHLQAFRRRGKSFLPLYLLLARRTIPIALAKKTLKPADAAKLRKMLRGRV